MRHFFFLCGVLCLFCLSVPVHAYELSLASQLILNNPGRTPEVYRTCWAAILADLRGCLECGDVQTFAALFRHVCNLKLGHVNFAHEYVFSDGNTLVQIAEKLNFAEAQKLINGL